MKALVLLIGFCLPVYLFGQSFEKGHFSVYGNLALPLGSFKRAVDSAGMGLGVGFSSNILFGLNGKKGYSPVLLGLDFTYITFGKDKQPETDFAPPYKTSFNNYCISAIPRFLLSDKPAGITPFIDAQIGLNIINTRTKIDKDLVDFILDEDAPEVIHTTNEVGVLYGGGLGIYKRKVLSEEQGSFASFSAKATFLSGNNITHVKRGSLEVSDGRVTYETTQTRYAIFMLQLGFVFGF